MSLARDNMTAVATFVPRLGEGAYGPAFGVPVDVPCWPEESVKLVRAADGSDVISSTRLWCESEHYEKAAPGTRVTFRDRETEVVARAAHDPGALDLPGLLEVTLL